MSSPPSADDHALPRAQRWRWRDGHAWHALLAATLALLASGGTLYLAYWWHVARQAKRAPLAPQRARHLLLFGKVLRDGAPDAELRRRVARVQCLLAADPALTVWLLGGRTGPGRSEAEAARDLLRQLGVAAAVRIELEARSAHTLENLRHARELIAAEGEAHVALVSSRSHLARCAMLARGLGLDFELVAAEARLDWRPATLLALSREALLTLWLDVGTRYARLIGHRGMIARVT